MIKLKWVCSKCEHEHQSLSICEIEGCMCRHTYIKPDFIGTMIEQMWKNAIKNKLSHQP